MVVLGVVMIAISEEDRLWAVQQVCELTATSVLQNNIEPTNFSWENILEVGVPRNNSNKKPNYVVMFPVLLKSEVGVERPGPARLAPYLGLCSSGWVPASDNALTRGDDSQAPHRLHRRFASTIECVIRRPMTSASTTREFDS